MRASRWSLLFGTALGVVGTLAVQRAMPEAEAGRGKPAQLDRQNFHDSLDLVLDRHVDPVNAPQMMARGLKHMVAGLDPYSHYLTAEERELARKRQREGAESGLVTALHQGDAGSELEVVAVIPGSPAAALGITAGTKLLGIRDRECDQLLSNMEAQLLLAGAPGERIDLAFDRGRGRETLELELAKTKADALVEGEL
ncbi:MAG: hypothetical protein KC457_15845, partial [Myxococcales bacterium]|nr:hypothetical protein [Myxococcales bacterium]